MTWAEFQIRAYAYTRIQEREDIRFREVAWNSLIGFHADPKKLPKNRQSFWKIGNKRPGLTDSMAERIKKAQEQYKIDVKEAK
jgi:hypothetical protein